MHHGARLPGFLLVEEALNRIAMHNTFWQDQTYEKKLILKDLTMLSSILILGQGWSTLSSSSLLASES